MLSLDHLDAIRGAEIDKIASFFPAGARVLEIGAGTGKQALELQRRGFEVTAIEIAASNYAAHRVFPIKDYDGRTIPLPDASVDVVFSSNVLEHVADLSRMHAEIRRVLATGGTCIHVLPTHTWRFWTTLTSYLEAISFFVSSVPQLVPRSAPARNRDATIGSGLVPDFPAHRRSLPSTAAWGARQRYLGVVVVPPPLVAAEF